MSSLAHTTHRSLASIALLLSIFGCSSRTPNTAPAPAGGKLSESERIAHVLSRLTFGARTGDAERVAAMGVDKWIDQQLHPEMIADSVLVRALVSNSAWTQPTTNVAALTAPPPRSMVPLPINLPAAL